MVPATYKATVEGVGDFTFRRRTFRDELKIAAEYSRAVDGQDHPTQHLALIAEAWATLRVLTVEGPAGWDLEALDPLDLDNVRRLVAAFYALREQEGRFRGGPAAPGASGGA
jgi:hypothetical protein